MKRIGFFLPEPLIKALKALARSTDISISEHIRRAIEHYLTQHNQGK